MKDPSQMIVIIQRTKVTMPVTLPAIAIPLPPRAGSLFVWFMAIPPKIIAKILKKPMKKPKIPSTSDAIASPLVRVVFCTC